MAKSQKARVQKWCNANCSQAKRKENRHSAQAKGKCIRACKAAVKRAGRGWWNEFVGTPRSRRAARGL